MAERVTLEVHQKRLADLIVNCGTRKRGGLILVFENDVSRGKPFSIFGKDGVPYSRIWINRFEREGWLKRVGVGHDVVTLSGRPYMGTMFHLTEDGEWMLEERQENA